MVVNLPPSGSVNLPLPPVDRYDALIVAGAEASPPMTF
jgi:hypothetical protein